MANTGSSSEFLSCTNELLTEYEKSVAEHNAAHQKACAEYMANYKDRYFNKQHNSSPLVSRKSASAVAETFNRTTFLESLLISTAGVVLRHQAATPNSPSSNPATTNRRSAAHVQARSETPSPPSSPSTTSTSQPSSPPTPTSPLLGAVVTSPSYKMG